VIPRLREALTTAGSLYRRLRLPPMAEGLPERLGGLHVAPAPYMVYVTVNGRHMFFGPFYSAAVAAEWVRTMFGGGHRVFALTRPWTKEAPHGR
jgi:hypothetical protein